MREKAKLLLILTACILNTAELRAQGKRNNSPARADAYVLKRAEAKISADGILTDWPDSLSAYNDEAKLFYGIRNDDDNLYLALRTNTPEGLNKVLMGGISVSATTDPRAKEKPAVTFPVLERPDREKEEGMDRNQQILSRIKVIRVNGFREILDGNISMDNTYGIRAGASFDKAGNLVQEIIIPLRLLDIDPARGEELTFHIRVNGLFSQQIIAAQQRQRGVPLPGAYGRPVPIGQQIDKRLAPVDFYLKGRLARR